MLALAVLLSAVPSGYAQTSTNPILAGNQPDPEIAYFNGRYYIYPTGGDQFRAYSSADLTNWRDEGVVFDLGPQCSWADHNGWAPTIVFRNGKYYFYYTAEPEQIGVAVGNSPLGPFTDLGRPLVPRGGIDDVRAIDPMVYIDGNGQAYLYYRGGSYGNELRIAYLNADMVSISSTIASTPPYYTEGPFMLKRNGTYYMMYSDGDWQNGSYQVNYSTASTPTGPWTYRGAILTNNGPFSGAGHHSVVQRPGCDEFYVAYHRYQNGNYSTRYAAIDRLYFRPDGSIVPINMTWTGVAARPSSAGCLADQDISTGVYRLVSKLSDNAGETIVLDVAGCDDGQNADVRTWRWLGGNCQRWNVQQTGDGFYKITSQLPAHRALDVSGCALEANADVRAYSDNGFDCQRWRIEAVGDGYYRIVSKQSGNVLDVSGCAPVPGTDVRNYPWLGGNCQRWKFEAVSAYERGALATVVPAAARFSVSPNPATNRLGISTRFAQAGLTECILTDLLGRTVLRHIADVDAGSQRLELPVHQLKPGVYTLRLRHGAEWAAQPVAIE